MQAAKVIPAKGFRRVFKGEPGFKAVYAAEKWLTEHGYSFGCMCYPDPIGVMKGAHNIPKWKHLTKAGIAQLDGRLTGEFRGGDITLELNEAPEGEESEG